LLNILENYKGPMEYFNFRARKSIPSDSTSLSSLNYHY